MVHHAGLFVQSSEVSVQGALYHAGKEALKVKRAAQDKYSSGSTSSWTEATFELLRRARLLLQYAPAIRSPSSELPVLTLNDAVFEWERDIANVSKSKHCNVIASVRRFLQASEPVSYTHLTLPTKA